MTKKPQYLRVYEACERAVGQRRIRLRQWILETKEANYRATRWRNGGLTLSERGLPTELPDSSASQARYHLASQDGRPRRGAEFRSERGACRAAAKEAQELRGSPWLWPVVVDRADPTRRIPYPTPPERAVEELAADV